MYAEALYEALFWDEIFDIVHAYFSNKKLVIHLNTIVEQKF